MDKATVSLAIHVFPRLLYSPLQASAVVDCRVGRLRLEIVAQQGLPKGYGGVATLLTKSLAADATLHKHSLISR